MGVIEVSGQQTRFVPMATTPLWGSCGQGVALKGHERRLIDSNRRGGDLSHADLTGADLIAVDMSAVNMIATTIGYTFSATSI